LGKVPGGAMRIYKLNKLIIAVRGNAEKFLSGLTSNTLEAPQNAFLSLHGRIIATFEQIKSGPDEFLLVIAPSAWGPLKTHADRYARLNKTTFEPVNMNVYFDLEGDAPLDHNDFFIPQRRGRMVLTNQALTSNVTDEEFNLFRLNHHIPLHGIDYTDEMVLNVHEYDFVSYTKGCFLGQEPVAKVHNRSKPTWQLAVRTEDQLTAEQQQKMTSKMTDPDSGKIKGFVFIPNT
jgi:folate-binding protein YgfZ